MDKVDIVHKVDKVDRIEKVTPDVISVINTDEGELLTLPITLSKRGIPCLFERGGSYIRNGSAQIVADKFGNKKKALCIFKHGYLACNNHAVIPVRYGDLVFLASTTDRINVNVKVYKIVNINKEDLKATIQHIVWDNKFPDPVFMAAYKACHYHCRVPYYIQDNFE